MSEQAFPEPTAGALILNAKGEVFLMRSHKWKGKFVIPGGHIELGERIEEALVREIREETGLEIHDIEFVDFQEFIFDDAYWKKRHFIFFDYACRTDATDVVLNDESQAYVWVPLEKALMFPIEPYTRKTIETYIRQHQQH